MLHVNSLKGKCNVKAIDDALADIQTGGSSLMGAYDKTMKMIESQDEGYRKLAKHTLSWVAFSSTPLTVIELQHALAIEPGGNGLNVKNITKLDVIISTCAGLITLQEGRAGRTVHLVHETTQDYFDKTQRWFGDVKSQLARLSLKYLTFPAFESGPCMSDHDLAFREAQHPFYVYLRVAFPRYIEGNHENVKVKAMLEKFFLHESYVQAYMQAQPQMDWYFTGSTPLHLALFYRIGNLIPLLMHKYGNKTNGRGLTPLHVAVSAEFYEGIASLISLAGLNINAVSPWKGTALSIACEIGDVKSVKMLLARKDIDRNLADEHGRTPLSYALDKGRLAITRLLLEWSDTDCISPDHRGINPLSYAALGGCEDCIKELLERPEVCINAMMNDQITILHWAIEKGRMSTIEYLLGQPDLDVNVADHLGRTPLIWCMAHLQSQIAVMLLLREDLQLNLVDKDGQSFVIWAAKFGSPCLSESLLERLGAQVLAKDINYRTALDHAAENNHWNIVKQLLSRYKTKIRIKHRFEDTALSHAISHGSTRMIGLLLDHIALEKNWWYVDALGQSTENDTLKAFTVLRTRLWSWMRNNPQWITPCLRRAADGGSSSVLADMLKELHHNSTGIRKEGVLFPSDRTWDDVAILDVIFEIPVEQVDVRDSLGQTALHAAAKRGDIATTRILWTMGADIGAKDTTGRTPLMCASLEPRFSKVIGMILNTSVYEQPRDGT
jgi:ankyrin repeat protein